MWWLLVGLGVIVVLFGTYALMKTASDADDEIDRLYNKYINNKNE